MPSATMRMLNERRKQQLESQPEQEAETNTTPDDTTSERDVDTHEQDTPREELPVEAPETDDNDEREEATPEPAGDDYERKFKRLSGKMSQVEREKNEAKKRAQELEERLAELKARERLAAERDSSKPDGQDEQDGWDFDWSEEGAKTKPQRARSQPEKEERNVSAEVERILAEKEQQKRHAIFNRRLDDELKQLGEESSFIELVNEPDFDEFIMKNRVRKALFADSAQHQDDEAAEIMVKLVREYLGKNNTVENKTTPNVKKATKPPEKPKAPLITEEEYLRAVRDKGVASKRKRANEIISAYHKQQNS